MLMEEQYFLMKLAKYPVNSIKIIKILENGEFLKVGSSKVQKTNVRIIAAIM